MTLPEKPRGVSDRYPAAVGPGADAAAKSIELLLRIAGLDLKAQVFQGEERLEVDLSGEDVDWCWRAQERGFSIAYDPSIIARHPARRTWTDLTAKTDRITVEMTSLLGTAGAALLARQAPRLRFHLKREEAPRSAHQAHEIRAADTEAPAQPTAPAGVVTPA